MNVFNTIKKKLKSSPSLVLHPRNTKSTTSLPASMQGPSAPSTALTDIPLAQNIIVPSEQTISSLYPDLSSEVPEEIPQSQEPAPTSSLLHDQSGSQLNTSCPEEHNDDEDQEYDASYSDEGLYTGEQTTSSDSEVTFPLHVPWWFQHTPKFCFHLEQLFNENANSKLSDYLSEKDILLLERRVKQLDLDWTCLPRLKAALHSHCGAIPNVHYVIGFQPIKFTQARWTQIHGNALNADSDFDEVSDPEDGTSFLPRKVQQSHQISSQKENIRTRDFDALDISSPQGLRRDTDELNNTIYHSISEDLDCISTSSNKPRVTLGKDKQPKIRCVFTTQKDRTTLGSIHAHIADECEFDYLEDRRAELDLAEVSYADTIAADESYYDDDLESSAHHLQLNLRPVSETVSKTYPTMSSTVQTHTIQVHREASPQTRPLQAGNTQGQTTGTGRGKIKNAPPKVPGRTDPVKTRTQTANTVAAGRGKTNKGPQPPKRRHTPRRQDENDPNRDRNNPRQNQNIAQNGANGDRNPNRDQRPNGQENNSENEEDGAIGGAGPGGGGGDDNDPDGNDSDDNDDDDDVNSDNGDQNVNQPNMPRDRNDMNVLTRILDRLVTSQEGNRAERHDNAKFKMFPNDKFDGTNPEQAVIHWNDFRRYWQYQRQKRNVRRDINDFMPLFKLSLTGIAYQWLDTHKLKLRSIPILKAEFFKRFNKWGQTLKQQMAGWNTLKYDYTNDNMDTFVQNLMLLANMLDMNEEQVKAKFKDCFDSNVSAHLLDCNDFELLQRKAEQLVQMYKPTTTSAVALSHLTVPPSEQNSAQTNKKKRNAQEHALQQTADTHNTQSNSRPQIPNMSNNVQPNPKNQKDYKDSNQRGRGQQNFRGRGQARGTNRGFQNQYQMPQPQPQNPDQPFQHYLQRGRGFQPNRRYQRGYQRFRGRNRGFRGYRQNYPRRGGYYQQRQPYFTHPQSQFQQNRFDDFYSQSGQDQYSQEYAMPQQTRSDYNAQSPNMSNQSQQTPQHLYVCTLCGYKGHYEHQCQVGRTLASHLYKIAKTADSGHLQLTDSETDLI